MFIWRLIYQTVIGPDTKEEEVYLHRSKKYTTEEAAYVKKQAIQLLRDKKRAGEKITTAKIVTTTEEILLPELYNQ